MEKRLGIFLGSARQCLGCDDAAKRVVEWIVTSQNELLWLSIRQTT